MRRRLARFLPIVLIALTVQILAPIGACWVAAFAISDPLLAGRHCPNGSAQKVPPTVRVRAPHCQRVAGKPANRVTVVRRRPRAAAALERQAPVIAESRGAGANASAGPPPAVTRFSLPQQSYSITSKQID